MASTGFLTAQTVMKEFPSTEELNQFEKERVKLSIFYARLAEECERKRRINEDEASFSETSLDSKLNRAWAQLKESEERLDRVKEIISLKELDKLSKEVNIEAKTPIAPSSVSIRQQPIPQTSQEDIIEKEQRADNIAYVTIKEEEEKVRRIAEESYLEEVEEEHRADNRAYATIKEEEEKIRRVAEISLKDEEETEYRAENKAYTIIQEEQERSRRIAEDSYLDDLSLKSSLKNRKQVALLEEQERSRRLRERPGASQLSELKVNAHVIATHCQRFFSGKKPKVAMFSKPKKVRRNLTTELEEKERRRRIQNPPSSDQLNKLRVVSLNAALAKTQKTSGQDVVVNKFKKNVYFKDSLVRLQKIKQLEEEARTWKMSLKIPKEQKMKLMKVSIDAADRATKKFGSKNIIVSKYKKPDQTIMLEEKERQRRLKEKLTTSQKDQLRKLSEMAADSAAKKISGRKLPISKSKVTKKPKTGIIETRDQVKQVEEKERRNRMNNPLTPKQFLQLKAISNMAAQSANTRFALKKKKRPALFKKPIAMKKDVTKGLEEQERQRRLKEKPSTEQLSQLKNFSQQIADSAGKKLSGQKLETSKFKKTPVAAVETERKRRTLHKPELLTKLRSVAHNVKETVEAKLSGQKHLPFRFKKATLKGLDNTRKLEEEERQRRMTDKITPEQRNKLRIFSHEVVDQVINKQRGKFVKPATFKKAQMKGFSKLQKLEEQERQRRISEKPSTEQLQKLKSISQSAAQATVTKQQQKKKPTFNFKKYKLTETVMRSRGLLGKMEENERQRRLANPPSSEQLAQLNRQSRSIVNEINKKLSGQKLQPVKFTMAKPVKGKRLSKSAEHKKRHQFRLYQTKKFPVTAPISQLPVEQKVTTTTTTTKTVEEPLEVRKNVVEKLSHEMFSKITKAVIPERR